MFDYFESFTKPVRKIGKASLLLAIIFSFISPIYIAIRYNCMPTGAQILGGYILIFATEATYYFVEPISYFPTLGEAGNYMSFLAGSIGGIRVIATLGAQEALGVQPGTQKSEIVSVMSIAASIITSLSLNVVGIVFGNVLFTVLPESITGMFSFVLPAVYGSMLYPYMKKSPIVGVVGLLAGFALRKTPFLPSWSRMLLDVAICVILGLQLAKAKRNKEKAAA